MPTGSPLTDRFAALLPSWLTWPLSAASTLFGVAGAVLVLLAAATGSIPAAVWGGIAFVAAAILWHAAEFAADEGR